MAQIYITKFDLERLQSLLDKKLRLDDYDQALKRELDIANVVDPKEIPADVITMNSRVRLIEEGGEHLVYSLVFPDDADFEEGKISILSPIGSSLIGYRVGDLISFPTPKGSKQVRVEDILYQPEHAGDFDL